VFAAKYVPVEPSYRSNP